MVHNKISIGLAILIISLVHISCLNSSTKHTGEVNILDKEPEVNLASHKPYDVEVYQIIFMGECYKVRYYQKENDTLASHEATYCITEDFDKAAYKWLTDTSVSIRLYNSITNKEKKFEVFGKGSTSGMKDE
jgi:hypothetical protein